MVREGKSNREIYRYISENYGKNQIAVPQNSWMIFLSMGLPYLLMGVIVVIALGFGWFWVQRGEQSLESKKRNNLTDDQRESIDAMVSSDENNPLQ